MSVLSFLEGIPSEVGHGVGSLFDQLISEYHANKAGNANAASGDQPGTIPGRAPAGSQVPSVIGSWPSEATSPSPTPSAVHAGPGGDMTGAGTVIPYQQAHDMYQKSRMNPTTAPATPPHIQGTNINSFMQSLGQQESAGSGGYNAINKDSGAIGKYQIMPSNWAPWAKAAGLPPNAAPTPQNQELVARNQIQALYNKYGNWNDVASVWYSGKPAAKANLTAPQGNYPPIGHYIESVLGRLTH